MNQLNSIILEGNLVRNPEGRVIPSGTALCSFCIATNRSFKQDGVRQKEVCFFDVETWGKLAENCEKNLKKGQGVRVVGRLKQSRWTDKEGGKQARIKIVGEHVEFKPFFPGSGKPASYDAEKGEPQEFPTEEALL